MQLLNEARSGINLFILRQKVSAALQAEAESAKYPSESNIFLRMGSKLVAECNSVDEVKNIIIGSTTIVYTITDKKYHRNNSMYSFGEIIKDTAYDIYMKSKLPPGQYSGFVDVPVDKFLPTFTHVTTYVMQKNGYDGFEGKSTADELEIMTHLKEVAKDLIPDHRVLFVSQPGGYGKTS